MRILIVGGTKFIGPHVVRQITERGHAVTVYHRGHTEAALPADVRHVHATAASIPILSFPSELLDPHPDVVVHMVAMGEDDARAAMEAFRGRTRRIVVLSSGDVYRAYGRFTRLEPGPLEPVPLNETSPLRTALYPHRADAKSPNDWVYRYEKILVERTVLAEPHIESVVLRLPKVYGPGGNADFATVYGYRHQPQWRWTHGYVENVAAAIVLAALHEAPPSRIYNVGEESTPSVAERIDDLRGPGSTGAAIAQDGADVNFAQDIVYDTTRIRRELGYVEPIPYTEGLERTLASGR